MKLKRIIFWSHLTAGVTAGLVILMMSVTGVLLTFERQMLGWAEQSYSVAYTGQQRLPAEQLLSLAREAVPSASNLSLIYYKDNRSPVKIAIGRSGQLLIDPYTGAILGEGPAGLNSFFGFVTQLHRWFALEGDSREIGAALTGASNLLFLFLLVSGTYLWLPRIWRWSIVRMNILFNPLVNNSRARDYNWHHVFSFWALIPLFFVITTATVFSYSWANNLVYSAFGEQPPQRRGPPGAANAERDAPLTLTTNALPLEQLLVKAQAHEVKWNSITLSAPSRDGGPVTFTIDQGTGGEPTKRHDLTLNAGTGEIEKWAPFTSRTPATQARIYIRFLHTGEALGVFGQLFAGLASAAACILVWTGLALAYRRLILPLFRRRSQK